MKLNHFKAQSLQACQSLAQIESEVTHVARQFRCAEFLHYAVEPGTLSMHLNRANFCKQRTCAVCAWLRASKLRIRLFGGMPRLLADYPNAKFLLLTLTIKNCHFQELRSQLRMMQAGWNRMHRSAEFPGIGFLKSVEVTRPRDYWYYGQFVGRMGRAKAERWEQHLRKLPSWDWQQWQSHICEEVHPHYHVLMVVDESYSRSNEEEFLDQRHWCNLWRRSARLDYDPVVDVRWVRNINGGILEASKYCLKPQSMTDVIGCFVIRQLHSIRLTDIGGIFNDYFSQRAVDAIAATGELGTEQHQQGVPCHYEWNGEKYSLTRLAHLEWELD